MDFIFPVGNPVEFFVFVLGAGIIFQVMVKLLEPTYITDCFWYRWYENHHNKLEIFDNKGANILLIAVFIGLILNGIAYGVFVLLYKFNELYPFLKICIDNILIIFILIILFFVVILYRLNLEKRYEILKNKYVYILFILLLIPLLMFLLLVLSEDMEDHIYIHYGTFMWHTIILIYAFSMSVLIPIGLHLFENLNTKGSSVKYIAVFIPIFISFIFAIGYGPSISPPHILDDSQVLTGAGFYTENSSDNDTINVALYINNNMDYDLIIIYINYLPSNMFGNGEAIEFDTSNRILPKNTTSILKITLNKTKVNSSRNYISLSVAGYGDRFSIGIY